MSRRTKPTVHIPVDPPTNELRPLVCAIFADAQKNIASHRKLVVNLRKIHEACCFEPESLAASHGKKNARDYGPDYTEDLFHQEFVRCVLRILPVRKADVVGEKCVRFVGMFLKHASERDLQLLVGDPEEATEEDDLPETPTARLTVALAHTILPLLVSKDKVVRYRATQLIAHIINSVDALDDDVFRKIRRGLLKRIRDKESIVRTQAVLGLGRLAGNLGELVDQGGDDDDEEDRYDSDQEEDLGLLEKLLSVLQNDPSAEVRRTLLLNLPILPKTLPYLLERARDQDAPTRRAVYARLLPALGDFRHLSVAMREKILRWGLRDRDETVRRAAARLFRERWIEDCAGSVDPREEADADGDGDNDDDDKARGKEKSSSKPASMDALLELLERIDVMHAAGSSGVALEAMRGFWEARPDYRAAVSFDDDMFWETLSAESAFAVRSFHEFCTTQAQGKYESLWEEKMPEVTRFASYLERYMLALLQALKRQDEADEAGIVLEEGVEEEITEQEFIIEQLLNIALTLDYADEVGRRKMFMLLRQTLATDSTPDEITSLVVENLRLLCAPDLAGEREFCDIVLQAVMDIHDVLEEEDGGDDEQDRTQDMDTSGASVEPSTPRPAKSKEAREAKAVQELLINMKCLQIVQCMLSNVHGSLKTNPHLVTTLNTLVVPAVRSMQIPVRERGLVCLGLCVVLDRELAAENLELFVHIFARGHAAMQVTCLHILTDMLNVHGQQLQLQNPSLVHVYVKALKPGKHADVQATATLSVCKLLLGRVIASPEVAAELLRTLVVAYFDPVSAQNPGVRQALNYFLPVFCYARRENQRLLQQVALDALHALYKIREALEDDDELDVDTDMVSLATVGACLVDWTDPRKVYAGPVDPSGAAKKASVVEGDVHLDLAMAILDRLDSGSLSKDEKKVLGPLLGKLYISPTSSPEKLRTLYEEVTAAVQGQMLAGDTPGTNALYKIHVSLGKVVNSWAQTQTQTQTPTSATLTYPPGVVSSGPGNTSTMSSVSLHPGANLSVIGSSRLGTLPGRKLALPMRSRTTHHPPDRAERERHETDRCDTTSHDRSGQAYGDTSTVSTAEADEADSDTE